MAPLRPFISLILLGLLTISCAYPNRINNFKSIEIITGGVPPLAEEAARFEAQFNGLTKRAEVTCRATDNSVRPTNAELREEKRYQDLKVKVAKKKANADEQAWVQRHERVIEARIAERAARKYKAHKYTDGQQTAAMLAAGKILNAGKSIGPGEYPHKFGNNERIPFDGGANKYEFPIKMDGSVATQTGDVRAVPDRVVFEWKKGVNPKLLGVMRHGPPQENGRADFFKC